MRIPIPEVIVLVLCGLLMSCGFTDNKRVQLEQRHIACHVDSDCTYAFLECSTCGNAVAKEFAASLNAKRDKLCKRYHGPVVDCQIHTAPVCAAGVCKDPQSDPE